MQKFFKKYHYFVILLTLSTLMESCNNNNPEPLTGTCYLSKFLDSKTGYPFTITYNSANNIAQFAGTFTNNTTGLAVPVTISATYNNSNQLIKIKDVMMNSKSIDSITYTFSNIDAIGNPGKMVTAYSYASIPIYFKAYSTFTYDSNKRLIKSVDDANSNNYDIYQYDNLGNLSSVTSRHGSDEYISQKFSNYDNKKNPFQVWGQIFNFVLKTNPSPNNALTVEAKTSSSASPTTNTNNLTYNDQGYPISTEYQGKKNPIEYNCK